MVRDRDETETFGNYVSRPSRDRDVETETTSLLVEYFGGGHRHAMRPSMLSLISSAPAKMNYPIMHLHHNSLSVVRHSLVLSLVCLSAELGLAVICGPDRKSSIIC